MEKATRFNTKAATNAPAAYAIHLIRTLCADSVQDAKTIVRSVAKKRSCPIDNISKHFSTGFKITVVNMRNYANMDSLAYFPRHRPREQKDSTAKHQGIRHEIETNQAGAFHDADRHVDDQLDQEHGQPHPRRRCAGLLANQ